MPPLGLLFNLKFRLWSCFGELKIPPLSLLFEPKMPPLGQVPPGAFRPLRTPLTMPLGLKLSPLSAQLFRYNLNDNPFCPSCGVAPETPTHFFLKCIKYVIRRCQKDFIIKFNQIRPFPGH